ncbi:MAG TPA: 23S rRNA (guanosine(2251)-2'-O)-methyltransferase RlmB [Candidatus Hydrogenedentes bacterium]|jgi:23S rRNA (guanosine2251-2'-O)-methyltransferase|nr:23S rRNA (guanosine(2251)-2'-O)-methyltransferase RlmB [Candidatus Hydrogenedentota bacterium]
MPLNPLEIVPGRLPALACLHAKKRTVKKLYLYGKSQTAEEFERLLPQEKIVYADRHQLDQLAGGVLHQGVLLHAAPLPVLDLDDWLVRHDRPDCILLALDCIEDPQNFGAMVRSAAACGASGVLFQKDRAAPVSPAAVKAAAGGMEYVDLIQVTNLARSLGALQEAGFWTAALDGRADTTLWSSDLTGRITLVIGNEGAGVRRLVREKCDYRLAIPLPGEVASLNASVAAGIALAECMRQRAAKD